MHLEPFSQRTVHIYFAQRELTRTVCSRRKSYVLLVTVYIRKEACALKALEGTQSVTALKAAASTLMKLHNKLAQG